MAKTKRLKTVTAGRLVYSVCYTQATARDAPRVRQQKTKCSSEARKKLNLRASWQKLELLLACNFTRQDYHLTLSYDPEHLPRTRGQARTKITKCIRNLREACKAEGLPCKYIYVTEGQHGDRRYHHHIIISGDFARRKLLELWSFGAVSATPIDVYKLEELARYLTKEPREEGSPVGAHAWSASLNLLRPRVESCLVEEKRTLLVPPKAYRLESSCRRLENGFGSYEYIKYILPEGDEN